jgi:ribosomal protein S18 acetylase RimI-like enzyme
MQLEVHRLDAARRADFFRAHCAERGTGGCYCVAWHVPTWEGWGERTDAENRSLREALFERGVHDGYLCYAGGEPVGWCQATPRDGLPKLAGQFRLAPDPGAFAIACFAVQPGARGRGVARALLAAVLADLPARGARHAEAFPKRGTKEPRELWNGPEALFRAAGFSVVRDDPLRPVLALDLAREPGRGVP